jgi:hypothetical protein
MDLLGNKLGPLLLQFGSRPATVEMFQQLCRRQMKEEIKSGKAETLFPM